MTTSTMAASSSSALGPLLKEWRALRGVSQLELALDAGVSQRHVSFVESGRSSPSREMILRLSETLDLPYRARNELLHAAGFAPTFQEREVDHDELREIRDILARILAHHEPFPAMVLDRSWNFVMRNDANQRILARALDGVDPMSLMAGRPLNFLRLMFHERGIGRRIRNWPKVGSALFARLRREARAYPGSPSEALLEEFTPIAGELGAHDRSADDISPTIPLELETGDGRVLRLTNTLTTFGTPQDVAVQELRIEMSYPLDAETDSMLREWGRPAPRDP